MCSTKRYLLGLLVTMMGTYSASALTPALTTVVGNTFTMGCSFPPPVGLSDEYPVHPITIASFRIGTYLVRWDEWQDVRNNYAVAHGYTDLAIGKGRAADHPVTNISWYDALKWCNALSERDGLTPVYSAGAAIFRTGMPTTITADFNASGYRLPTEAEWEFAARGGVPDAHFPANAGVSPAIDGLTLSHAQANYVESYLSYDATGTLPGHAPWTHPDFGAPNPSASTAPAPGIAYTSPVTYFPPNGYGLHDMAGNIWQWCWDYYGEQYYSSFSTTIATANPNGPPTGSTRVLRGGSWDSTAFYARVSNRAMDYPVHKLHGFRVAQKYP